MTNSRILQLLRGAALALLAGCATLTESTQQMVLLQTIVDNREVAGVGCILSNKAGRWFVTSPGRVLIKKSAGDLSVDCRRDELGVASELVASKENASLWGNLVLSAGLGYFVDRNTGAGFDYPSTLTVILHAAAAPPETGLPPARGSVLY